MDKFNLKELQKLDTNNIKRDFEFALRRNNGYFKDFHIKSIVCAYAIYKMQTENIVNDFDNFINSIDCSNEVKAILNKYIGECWDIIKSNTNKYSSEELIAFILFNNSLDEKMGDESSTPFAIMELALRILDIKDSDEVLELCSGIGNFLAEMEAEDIKAQYTGVELNYVQNEIAIIRASLLRDNFSYLLTDSLDYKADSRFDKVFANYPFMLKGIFLNDNKKSLSEKFSIPMELIRRASTDWLFNLRMLDNLKDDGKAVAIMTAGNSWNDADKNMRKYFVENGFIEAVIALPSRIFYGTNISTALIVLSKNNKSVRLVDAKELFSNERVRNVLTSQNIEEIMQMLLNDGDKSIEKSIEELSDNNYVLDANRYLDVIPTFKNGVEFGDVIKKITRGYQQKAENLDEFKSVNPTPYRYLLLSNINYGIISLDSTNQYLTEIPENLKKYLIKNNSIVLSKISSPFFKSAVAQIDEGTNLIATGNMYVIELDESRINPYYLQSFLASELGSKIIRHNTVGTIMPTITIEKLKKIIIPLPSLDVQAEIANRYIMASDELVMLTRRVERLKIELSEVFDEEEIPC